MLSSFKVYNGLAPATGPRAVRFLADFSVSLALDFDLSQETDKQFEFVQAVYIDNSNNPNALIMDVSGLPFSLAVEAGNAGMFPIYSAGTFRARLTTAALLATPVSMIFLNVPTDYYSVR